ncbi:MAG: GNAT family N-acetyltransferase [Thermaerobacter sp.]|nr:GNAT family N-acetyltransferase [Thermaerobacter sp.]
MEIRRAQPREAPSLTALAFRSKAVWGYKDAFMEQCREELTLTAEYISSREVYVIGSDLRVVGFYGMSIRGPIATLDFLFVDPGFLREGMGRDLWNHAIARAKLSGAASVSIDAEPHAELFYRLMGAQRIGVTASGSIPGRVLPQLRFTIIDS